MLSLAPLARQQYCGINSWVAGHMVGNKNAQSELTFDFQILFCVNCKSKTTSCGSKKREQTFVAVHSTHGRTKRCPSFHCLYPVYACGRGWLMEAFLWRTHIRYNRLLTSPLLRALYGRFDSRILA